MTLNDVAEALKKNWGFEVWNKDKWIWEPSKLFPNNVPVECIRVADPYKELREASVAGKQILFKAENGTVWYKANNPTFTFPAACYKVEDPYQHLRDALAAGKEIEGRRPNCTQESDWRVLLHPFFGMPVECYRVKDPLREIKEAHENGKVIEVNGGDGFGGDCWIKLVSSPSWKAPAEKYRIAPETVTDANLVSKPDPYQHLKDALKAGKDLQFCTGWLEGRPGNKNWDFSLPPDCYRIKDEYAELKKAVAEGKSIEVRHHSAATEWCVADYKLNWNLPVDCYRIYNIKS